MECNEPGAIRDEELFAYLAGETIRPVVIQHLARCLHCSSQLVDYRRIERKLTSKLYRWDCPPNQVLGEYQLGLLSNQLMASVKLHLSTCVLCATEVVTLREFLSGDPLLVERPTVAQKRVSIRPSALNNHNAPQGAKGLLEQVREQSRAGLRRIVATLQPQQPRLAFRGSGSGVADAADPAIWPRRYAAEDLSISLQVEHEVGRRNSLQLIGLVTRLGAALESLQGTPVLLSSQSSTVYTQQVDELGNFVFSSITPATYTLELQLPTYTIVVDQFPLGLQE